MNILKEIRDRDLGPFTILKSIYLLKYCEKTNPLSLMIHSKTKTYIGKNVSIKNYGKFKLGFSKTGTTFISKDRPILELCDNSTLTINGIFNAGPGSCISIGNNAEVILGDNSSITANSKIISHKKIIIGDNVLISWDVQIMDTDFHNILIDNYEQKKEIVIEDNVWIGSRATILKGVTIGKGSVIAAGSVVTKDVPENTLVAGVPAKIIRSNISWGK